MEASMFRIQQASHALSVALLLSLLAPFNAKADRFDISSFDAPPRWIRKEQTDGLVFESRQAGTDSFCLINVGRGFPATVSLAEELDRAWSAVMDGQTFAGDPETLPLVDIGDGLTLARRIAPVRVPKGVFITSLNLLRGGDRLVLVLATVSDRQALDRCGNAQGDFLAGMKLDMTMPLWQPPVPATAGAAPASASGGAPRSESLPAQGGPDPQMAARFNNSVIGKWQWAQTTVNWGFPATKQRFEINVRFERDGKYSIRGIEWENGTYRVDGPRILMRPESSRTESYTLDWYFGTHPEARADWGLILRSSVDWAGGDKNEWRAFKPPE